MNDEKYLFISDVRDKSRTARGYHNKRHHAGKAGACKLPSDYLTKKELKKMNGEPTTYRINDPMTWAEFTEMPDDLKVMYINWIREEFQAPDSAISDMFCIHRTHLSRVLRAIGVGPTGRAPNAKWDKEGFAAWAGIEEKAKAEPQDVIEDTTVYTLRDLIEDRPFIPEEIEPKLEMIPIAGCMNFEGHADQALRIIGNVLGSACVRLHVSWNPITTEDDLDG